MSWVQLHLIVRKKTIRVEFDLSYKSSFLKFRNPLKNDSLAFSPSQENYTHIIVFCKNSYSSTVFSQLDSSPFCCLRIWIFHELHFLQSECSHFHLPSLISNFSTNFISTRLFARKVLLQLFFTLTQLEKCSKQVCHMNIGE